MKKWKVILAALVIFGAGVVTGGLTVRIKSRQPSEAKTPSTTGGQRPRVDLVSRMQAELGLTQAQKEQIEQILRESRERSKKIWESASEEHRKLRESIRAVLSPEQQTKFEAIFKRGPHRQGEGRSREDGRRQEERRNQNQGASEPSGKTSLPPSSVEKR